VILDQLPPGRFGLVFLGGGQDSTPFGDGLRCAIPGPPGDGHGGGFLRLRVFNSGAAGKAFIGPGIGEYVEAHYAQPFAAGSTWYFQGYYRDTGTPCGSMFNLTNGLSVTFQ